MTRSIVSNGSGATEQVGERVGKWLRGGEVIELISDLGGGKTTFVRGLAKGMGSHDHVSSPSFTISKVYEGDKLGLHHFDFYRLQDGGHVALELAEASEQQNSVVVVEWADVVAHVLPQKRLSIAITNLGDEKRQIEFNYPNELAYLLGTIR